ncbi:POT family [Pyrenophora seminiperda CCB06]|uniref:POT family n=1 Tax=Pyrenophora seminiperda CCB06 TaxID=1302712 RepID=A0A3M7MGK6_9PLEO|nr:POT family [Pyrenophora seminiperda CCB06]
MLPVPVKAMHENEEEMKVQHSNGDGDGDNGPPPPHTSTLRRIPDRIPWVVLLILIVELGERFTYFGLSAPLQNYIKNPPPGSSSHLPGALDRGQSVATALSNFFKFWAYASTVLGAIVADQYLGRFKTIACACFVYICGLVILVATATPAGIHSGAGFGGLVAAMAVIGLGTGSIKANVTPMCAEQYRPDAAYRKRLPKTGKWVIVDPDLTVERMFNWFYWAVNVGALSPLITVNVEAKVGFWVAYLIPLVVIVIAATVFILSSRLFIQTPPHGSAVIDAVRIVTIAVKEGGFDKAKPSALEARGALSRHRFAQSPNYTDRSFFLFLPLYFVCWIQIWNNLISQAGAMALHGTPNDLLQNLDPIALIIFIPLLDSYTDSDQVIIYPLLRKYKINFSPVLRMAAGFIMASIAMAYASVLQYYIYKSPPNSIHVWIQAPAYILVAFSEAFVIITGLELAYTKAPTSLRSLVSALFWLTIGIAAAICIALAPVSQDPYLVWMYGSLAIVGFVAGCALYICFRNSFDDVPVIVGTEAQNEIDVSKDTEHAGKLSVEDEVRWHE